MGWIAATAASVPVFLCVSNQPIVAAYAQAHRTAENYDNPAVSATPGPNDTGGRYRAGVYVPATVLFRRPGTSVDRTGRGCEYLVMRSELHAWVTIMKSGTVSLP